MTEEELQKSNWESRKETLTILFNRLLQLADTLDGYSAVVFTNPMATILSGAIHDLATHNEIKEIDGLINNALDTD